MGMTDIDDKIVARARETGVGVRALARRYEAEFMRDMRRLNVCGAWPSMARVCCAAVLSGAWAAA
jgi:cysteinyl-tRNA synthetase